MMNIFSDRACLPTGSSHVVMLYPFWGKNPEDPRSPFSGRFDRYMRLGRRFFRMTSLTEADIAVLPMPWESVIQRQEAIDLATRFVEQAHQARKPVVIFFWSDSDQDVSIENSVIFRTSLYRSHRKTNEFAMPAWSEDFLERHLGSQLRLRSKVQKPVVGFCGLAEPLKVPFKRKLKNVLRWGADLVGLTISNPGLIIRAKAMRVIEGSPRVETNFIVREGWHGGVRRQDEPEGLALMQKTRLEYVQNMVESDFVLCARGAGNYSYRLYEILSCGRIPVFVDTDCFLPYHPEINWKEYCVWVDEREVGLIANKVAEFYDALSPDEFVELQRECRSLWENYLSPEGFFGNFHRHFP